MIADALAGILVCAAPTVTDGDTIRCADGVRLRIAGADAADMITSGRCRPRPKAGAWCDNAAAARATENLRRLIRGKTVTYRQVDANPCRRGFQLDPYAFRGRVVAVVWAGGVSIGSRQIAIGMARPWRCDL